MIKMLKLFYVSLLFNLLVWTPVFIQAAQETCLSYLSAGGSVDDSLSILKPYSTLHSADHTLTRLQAKQLKLMLLGLNNTSRSVRFSPLNFLGFGPNSMVTTNFKNAAIYVLSHSRDLSLDLKTSVKLNEMLTQDLVDPKFMGDINFRPHSKTRLKATPFHLYPQAFYHWLETPEAQRLLKSDPIRLAELAHHTISALDSFPDGNGRLARMFSDLILLKAGLNPAYYPSQSEYFTWNAASGASRDQQLEAYIKSVQLGQNYMEAP